MEIGGTHIFEIPTKGQAQDTPSCLILRKILQHGILPIAPI